MEQNLSLYHIFYTVASCGNISRAAEKLYISQPAISRSIRKLEDSLGLRLFGRSSRGVTLTEDGKILYAHVREAFCSLETAGELLRRRHALGVSHLRIGASTTLCKYVLLPFLQSFVRRNPHVRVTISCQSTYQTLALLEEQKIDLGLVGRPAALRGLEFLPLRRIQDTFAATSDYLKNLKLREQERSLFGTAVFMMLDEENITRQFVNSYVRDHAIELSNILEVSTMDLLIEFAKTSLGIACVIREFVQTELENGELCEVKTGIHFPRREIGFVFSKEFRNLPFSDDFLSWATRRSDAQPDLDPSITADG